MSSLVRFGTLLAVAVLLPVSRLRAQENTTTFNIAAGFSLATGDFGSRNDAGYNITAGIGTMQRGTQFGFRGEAFYNEFNSNISSGTSHAGGATINILYDLMAPTAHQSNTLYAIGGIGYYSTREPFNIDAQTNFGWNAGAGFRFPLSGFSVYLEARYHSVNAANSVTFVPISFGLVF